MSGVVGGLFVFFLDCRRKEKPPRLEWKMEVNNYRSGDIILKSDFPEKGSAELEVCSLIHRAYNIPNGMPWAKVNKPFLTLMALVRHEDTVH